MTIIQHCDTTADLPLWVAVYVRGTGWAVNDGDMLQLFNTHEQAVEYIDYCRSMDDITSPD